MTSPYQRELNRQALRDARNLPIDAPLPDIDSFTPQQRAALEEALGYPEREQSPWWKKAISGYVAGSEGLSGAARMGLARLTPGQQEIEREFGKTQGNLFSRLRQADVASPGVGFKTPFENVNIGGFKVLPSEITTRGISRFGTDPANILAAIPFAGVPIRAGLLPLTAAARGGFGALKGATAGALRGSASQAVKGAGTGFAGGARREAASMLSPELWALRRAGRPELADRIRGGIRGDAVTPENATEIAQAAQQRQDLKQQRTDATRYFTDDSVTTNAPDIGQIETDFLPKIGVQVGADGSTRQIGSNALVRRMVEFSKKPVLGATLKPFIWAVSRGAGFKQTLAFQDDVTRVSVAGSLAMVRKDAVVENIGLQLSDQWYKILDDAKAAGLAPESVWKLGGENLQYVDNIAGANLDDLISRTGNVSIRESLEKIKAMPAVNIMGMNSTDRKNKILEPIRNAIRANEGVNSNKLNVVDTFDNFMNDWEKLSERLLDLEKKAGIDVRDITEVKGGANVYFPHMIEKFVASIPGGSGKDVGLPKIFTGRKLAANVGNLVNKRVAATDDAVKHAVENGVVYRVDDLVGMMKMYVDQSYTAQTHNKIIAQLAATKSLIWKGGKYTDSELALAKNTGKAVKLPVSKKFIGFNKEIEDGIYDAKKIKRMNSILNLEPNQTDRVLESIARYTGISRTTKAGLDFGWWFIQGLPQLLLTPGKAARNLKTILATLLPEYTGTQKGFAKFKSAHDWKRKDIVRHHHDTIMTAWRDGTLDEMSQGGVLLSKFGTDIFESTRNRGPLFFIRTGTQGKRDRFADISQSLTDFFGSRFEYSNDLVRIDTWRSFREIFQIADLERRTAMRTVNQELADALPKWQDELGSFTRAAAGGFDSRVAGVTFTQQRLERAVVFFSPRYTRASMALIGKIFDGGIQGEMAETMFRRMLVSGLLFHYNTARMLGQEPNLDPSDPDFLTHRVQGNKVGFGGFWLSASRLFGNMLEDPKSIAIGDDKSLTVKESLRTNPIVRFLRGRLAPGGSLAASHLVFGSDYLGKEFETNFDRLQDVASDFVPFAFESAILDPRYSGGIAGQMTAGLVSFAGFRQFPTSPYDYKNDIQDALAFKHHGKDKWSDLTKLQQNIIRVDYKDDEDVKRLFEAEQAIFESRERTGTQNLNSDITSYYQERKVINRKYLDAINEGLMFWEVADSIVFDSVQFKENYLDVELTKRRLANEALREKYPEVFQYFKSGLAGENEAPEDIAFQLYMDIIYTSDEWENKETREIDYIKKQQAEQDFYNEFPDPKAMEAYIQGRLEYSNSETLPTDFDEKINTYFRGRDVFSYYWDAIPQQVFSKYSNRSYVEEVYNEWQRANKSLQLQMEDDPVIGSLLKQVKGDISRVRKARRAIDKDLDAWLFRWGYTNTLVHPANIPDRDIIRDYHYNKIDIRPKGNVTPYGPAPRPPEQKPPQPL